MTSTVTWLVLMNYTHIIVVAVKIKFTVYMKSQTLPALRWNSMWKRIRYQQGYRSK